MKQNKDIETNKEIENNINIAKSYSAKDIEQKWYQHWETQGYFKQDKKSKKPDNRNIKNSKNSYSIVMPPPNVTGILHAGHALDVTTQDSIVRYKRMKGFKTVWIPGMDHAGIATQNVVEKLVQKEEQKTRHQFSRKEFTDKIWKWKEEYGGIIAKQQRAMGASPDWDYFMFTMDKDANNAVNQAFVSLFNEGLIYQADYIVNWDTQLRSAISDAEVEHVEVKGNFYHINYKVEGSNQLLEIATTRPETLLGDTAVAVNPNDDRYKHLIGQYAIVPITNRKVPIIGDDYVSLDVGTGCLKVTPGHDFNDFEIGKRHNLKIINILNQDGTLNHNCLHFINMTCTAARKQIVRELEELNLLVKIIPHKHQVGHGDRSKTIIEPMISKQWFLNTSEMSKQALKAVEEKDSNFIPKGWENTYFSWLRNPRPWCISRQLWWGHQIPIYYCKDDKCLNQWADKQTPTKCPKCNSTKIIQDPDVLDTWFSSSLWPLTTLGWPNKSKMQDKQFDKFFPTSTLITGHDIIFFWVARMMMMSLKFTKKAPFKNIYIHAIVRDKQGRKMSKSLNNGIDPLKTIAEFGADAFRFTLASGSGYNRNINLDFENIISSRNFLNKIWNAFRFIYPHLEHANSISTDNIIKHISSLDIEEKWILSELNNTIKIVTESFDLYRYDDVCNSIYTFVYDKFCSLFIEMSKPFFNSIDQHKKKQRVSILKYVLSQTLALLHPIAPFITEEMWSYIKNDEDDLLIISEYPEYYLEMDFKKEQEIINHFAQVINKTRFLKISVQMSPKQEIELYIVSNNQNFSNYIKTHQQEFFQMCRVKKVFVITDENQKPKLKSITTAIDCGQIMIPVDGLIDIENQINRLNKEKLKIQKELDKVNKKIENSNFIKNAKHEVVEEVKAKQALFQSKITTIFKSIDSLK